jgi:hypothetical protein
LGSPADAGVRTSAKPVIFRYCCYAWRQGESGSLRSAQDDDSSLEALVKIVLNIVGVLLVLFGGIWFLQGMNLFPGHSFMNGQTRWSINGGIAFVVGVIVLIWANRRAKTPA